MNLSLTEKLSISRKRLIKEINQLRKERKTLLARPDVEQHRVEIKVINARLSEKWKAHSDVVKTMALVENVTK